MLRSFRLLFPLCPAVALFACFPLVHGQSTAAANRLSSAEAVQQIRAQITRYTQSVDAADPKLAAQVWLTTADVCFIDPVGEAHGWNEIVQQVYRHLMGQLFTQRRLTVVGQPSIHVFGDAAVAEFHWDFVATRRRDGGTEHTIGRESQFYVHFPDKGWRLVHVHYSGPAISAPVGGTR